MVITNISKRTNIRLSLQEAIAFHCKGIFIIGQKNFNIDPPSDTNVCDIPRPIQSIFLSGIIPIIRFNSWNDCTIYLNENNIILVGIEIDPKSILLNDFIMSLNQNDNNCSQQHSDIAFIFGNEGTGLNQKHINSCHTLVRIPQYNTGTASLNVATAASIVLYQFHLWQIQQNEKIIQEDATKTTEITT